MNVIKYIGVVCQGEHSADLGEVRYSSLLAKTVVQLKERGGPGCVELVLTVEEARTLRNQLDAAVKEAS